MEESESEWEPRYLPVELDDCEDPENYELGGLHPVHLGDEYDDGRYRIVHKLCWGGFSTVWLARDNAARRWVALKIVTARDSPDYEARSVAMNHPALANARIFSVPERHFWLKGPNGRHLCLVLPPLGPDLSRLSKGLDSRLNSQFARQVSLQAARALALLHSLGLCHGDLTASNMVLRLVDDFDSYDEAELLRLLGAPETEPLETESGEPPGPQGPEYMVAPLDFCDPAIAVRLFTGEVCIIDFDQSFAVASGPAPGSRPGLPAKYLAPEVCVGRPLSPSSDVWTLGCAIFRIRQGEDPFFKYSTNCPADALRMIVQNMGALPEDWMRTRFTNDGFPAKEDEPGEPFWVLDKARPLGGRVRGIVDEPAGLFIDADGEVMDDPGDEDPGDAYPPSPDFDGWRLSVPYPPPLRSMVWKPTAICIDGDYIIGYTSGGETEKMLEAFPKIPEREADLLLDLLSKMFVYDPDKRLTAEEVVAHPWFRFSE